MPNLKLNSQTQEMDNDMDSLDLNAKKEDSFVQNISSRSPVKMSDADVFVDKDTPIKSIEPAEDVSFSEQIISRSPVKRIEDSVEAMDVLEDTIEKIQESIPALPDSPVKRPQTKKVPGKSSAGPSTAFAPRVQTIRREVVKTNPTGRKVPAVPAARIVPKPTPPKVRMSNVKPATSTRISPIKPASTSKPLVRSRPSTLNKHSSPSKAEPSGTSPRVGEEPASVKPKRHIRVSSVVRPPFVPQKSTKEPTRPTFSLPGDAVAQKLKAQREERMKKDEEEAANKKKTFKARPAPRLSTVPVVKETVTSKARLSLVPSGNVIGNKPIGKENVKSGSATGSLRMNGTQTLRKQPAPRRTAADLFSPKKSTPRSVSAITAPKTAEGKRAISSTSSEGTTDTVVHNTISSPKPKVNSKVSGKEVFNRTRSIQDKLLKEKREKEEAAKRARKEAAEKGRAASRAWAEKKLKGSAREAGPVFEAVGEQGGLEIGGKEGEGETAGAVAVAVESA